MAVSKYHPVEALQEAYAAGQRIFGESHVQELQQKHEVLPSDIEWHFIGHLQTNKVKYIAPYVSLIHAVDTPRLLMEIEKQASKAGRSISCLLELHVAEEESKFGVTIEGAGDLVREILDTCENIRIRGLMSVAPIAEDPRDVKPYFDAVKAKYDELAQIDDPKLDFVYLSMGMSHDFAVAIEAGSNLVRVGSAIFGERDYEQYRKDQEAKKNGNVQ